MEKKLVNIGPKEFSRPGTCPGDFKQSISFRTSFILNKPEPLNVCLQHFRILITVTANPTNQVMGKSFLLTTLDHLRIF